MDFVDFETALDERRLWISEYTNKQQRWYQVRRNGKTKLWYKLKNRHRWEIPIKWKLSSYARVTEKTELDGWFKIQPGPDGDLVGAELVT